MPLGDAPYIRAGNGCYGPSGMTGVLSASLPQAIAGDGNLPSTGWSSPSGSATMLVHPASARCCWGHLRPGLASQSSDLDGCQRHRLVSKLGSAASAYAETWLRGVKCRGSDQLSPTRELGGTGSDRLGRTPRNKLPRENRRVWNSKSERSCPNEVPSGIMGYSPGGPTLADRLPQVPNRADPLVWLGNGDRAATEDVFATGMCLCRPLSEKSCIATRVDPPTMTLLPFPLDHTSSQRLRPRVADADASQLHR